MNATKNVTLFKWTFHEQPSKIHLQRKQSFQFDKCSPQSSQKNAQENFISSYPIFESKRSKILNSPILDQNVEQFENEKKKSSFLKNYNEKLKRQRKKQNKLKSSLKNLKSQRNVSSTISPTLKFRQNITSIQPNTKFYTNLPQLEQNSQILVLKKSQFLDTSSNSFRLKKDYSNDSNLHLLLKEIYQIRNEERREIQKIKEKKLTMDSERNQKKKRNITLQNYFTRFERGFSLPTRRKFIFNDVSPSKCNQLSNNVRVQSKLASNKKTVDVEKENKKMKLQKLYNFKHVDPWDFPKNRQHNQQTQGTFFLQQLNS